MNSIQLLLLWINALNYSLGNSTHQAFPESESICEIDPIVCPEDSTTCVSKDANDYYCKCLPDYELKEGNVEELNKEACIEKQKCNFGFPMCPEDSTKCVPKGSDDFYCECLSGYKLKGGKRAEENKESCLKMNRCDSDPNLCPTNSSKCVPLELDDGYYCECLPGFKRNIQIDDICIEETTDTPEPESTNPTREVTTDGPQPEYSSQISCDCGPNSEGCELKYDGYKECKCRPGYAQRRDECAECNCGPKSNGCVFEYNKHKVCQCLSGYAQRGDICSQTCTYNNDCLFGGLCLKRLGNYFCSCRSGFRGDRCEKNEACENLNVTCRARNAECNYITRFGKDFCECHLKKGNRWDVNTCDVDGCKFDTCVQGKCQASGYYLQCNCDDGITGPNCDTITVVLQNNFLAYSIVAGILAIAVLIFLCGLIYLCIDIRKLKKEKNLEAFRSNLSESRNKNLFSA